MIFKNRVCIIDHELFSYKKMKYLLLVIADSDSNNDNVLNRKDLLNIYMYNIQTNKLTCITESAIHIIDLIKPSTRLYALSGSRKKETSNEIFVKIGYDKNSDGIFNAVEEPVFLKRIDIDRNKLTSIMNQSVNEELQSILDGKLN